MGVPLLTESTSSAPPTVKLREVGQYLDAAVAGIKVIPRTEYGTGQPMLDRQGRPKTQVVLTVVIAGGTGCIKRGDVEVPLSEAIDEVASVYIAGRDRWDKDGDAARKAEGKQSFSWSGALDAHGQLEVGDVFRWTYESDVPGMAANPRKLRTFRLRKPKAEEQARTDKCMQIHRGATAVALEPDDAPF
jgi:hypothetical protein